MPTYLVQGCGVTLICAQGNEMLGWIKYIINRGGVPQISILEGGR